MTQLVHNLLKKHLRDNMIWIFDLRTHPIPLYRRPQNALRLLYELVDWLNYLTELYRVWNPSGKLLGRVMIFAILQIKN